MADNDNDDCLSVSSDFVRIPNTPLEEDDLDLDEGRETPMGFAASKPSIDPDVVAAFLKKVDMIVVQNDKLGKDNSGLLTKVDTLMELQQVMNQKVQVLCERLPSAELPANSIHNKEQENIKSSDQSKLKEEASNNLAAFHAQMAQQQADFQSKMAEQQAAFHLKMDEQRVDFQSKMAEQQADFQSKLDEQRVDFQSNLDAMQNKHDDELDRLRKEITTPKVATPALGRQIGGGLFSPIPAVQQQNTGVFGGPLFIPPAGGLFSTTSAALAYPPIATSFHSNFQSDRSVLDVETNKKLTALQAQIAAQQSDFQSKLDTMQREHDRELDGLRKENILLKLTSLHEPIEILKHLEPEFVELTLVNNTEEAAWDLVDDEAFSVSGNSVTRIGENSWRKICSKRGFSIEPVYTSNSNPHKVQLIFHYFEITIDKTEDRMFVGLAAEDFVIEKSVGLSYLVCNDNTHDGFAEDDTVGCGLMTVQHGGIQTTRHFYTKNGKIWGTPVALPLDAPSVLYPAITLFGVDDKVTANFGNEPFKYGIPPAKGLLC